MLYAIKGVDGGKEKGGIVCSGGSEEGGGAAEVVHMENDTKFCCSNTIIYTILCRCTVYALHFRLKTQISINS